MAEESHVRGLRGQEPEPGRLDQPGPPALEVVGHALPAVEEADGKGGRAGEEALSLTDVGDMQGAAGAKNPMGLSQSSLFARAIEVVEDQAEDDPVEALIRISKPLGAAQIEADPRSPGGRLSAGDAESVLIRIDADDERSRIGLEDADGQGPGSASHIEDGDAGGQIERSTSRERSLPSCMVRATHAS